MSSVSICRVGSCRDCVRRRVQTFDWHRHGTAAGELGLTLRKNSVPFSMICWICRKPAVYMRRNWSPTVMLRRPV